MAFTRNLLGLRKVKSIAEIFWRFLLLGLISFGGPTAHLGYFRHSFVDKLNWLSAEDYNRLILLSQFLPGPSSSQVGFAIGLTRGGPMGGWAAFLGFTLPSFLILLSVALYQPSSESVVFSTVVSCLKLLAVIVVADACLTMFQTFSTTRLAQFTTLLTAAILLSFPNILWLPFAILATVFASGWRWLPTPQTSVKKPSTSPVFHSPTLTYSLLALMVALVGLYWLLPNWLPQSLQLFAQFIQAGSLVFGGGHVVLPLLEPFVADQVGQDIFLSGYALAQTVPGPMFTFATYLGTFILPQSPIWGATLATLGIFLPGLLLMLACHQHWQNGFNHPPLRGGIFLLNASVVGLLFAVFINPVFSSAIHTLLDLSSVIIGFALFRIYRPHILWLLVFFAIILPLIQLNLGQ